MAVWVVTSQWSPIYASETRVRAMAKVLETMEARGQKLVSMTYGSGEEKPDSDVKVECIDYYGPADYRIQRMEVLA